MVTVVKAGHPLRGRQLRADLGNVHRRDGKIPVVLPDGSNGLIPIRWTDAVEAPPETAGASVELRFNIGGLRRLLRLVAAMSCSDGRGSSTT